MSDRIRNISVTGEHLVHADARLHPLRIDELAGRNTLISMSDTSWQRLYLCPELEIIQSRQGKPCGSKNESHAVKKSGCAMAQALRFVV
jgi:hypothetical protein